MVKRVRRVGIGVRVGGRGKKRSFFFGKESKKGILFFFRRGKQWQRGYPLFVKRRSIPSYPLYPLYHIIFTLFTIPLLLPLTRKKKEYTLTCKKKESTLFTPYPLTVCGVRGIGIWSGVRRNIPNPFLL